MAFVMWFAAVLTLFPISSAVASSTALADYPCKTWIQARHQHLQRLPKPPEATGTEFSEVGWRAALTIGVDLLQTADATIADGERYARARGLALQIPASGMRAIVADFIKNVSDHAYSKTETDKRFWLSFIPEDAGIQIIVRDAGPGRDRCRDRAQIGSLICDAEVNEDGAIDEEAIFAYAAAFAERENTAGFGAIYLKQYSDEGRLTYESFNVLGKPDPKTKLRPILGLQVEVLFLFQKIGEVHKVREARVFREG